MINSGFSRVLAGMILLMVLFTQAGINLLHAHQGTPEPHAVAVSSLPDNGASTCQACAQEGVPSLLFADTSLFILPEFTSNPFVEAAISGIILPVFDFFSGRAPPVS